LHPISVPCSAVQLGRFSRLEQKRSSKVLHISHYRFAKHLQRLRFTAAATKDYPLSAELQDARAALHSAGANFSLLLLRSDVFYTCDNSFPIPYRTETNDAATLNAVTRCHWLLRTQDAFAAAAE
jgi:hypothetical protein